ncbi:pyridoxal-phosphate dependent enzyme [Caldivirga maquilingensis]|uniref:Pyridoxal-5'-phosphate-dependent protein beta subunit n=1 Tax=Caldivirga maquilingensis (strain ATCC 700844 / DSM 13496 / JCM 10307 / IC-167) TaxID=397948 RepID=A8M9U5_CALMQ|nr:pyridoxal-phosphate dependent enzyme [Caldivirga maquilingensis]ABW02416.1 Pyridoxal-5'-phosphate-dependent protein beta subunit [Caldivirga maquilingensis IC-167]
MFNSLEELVTGVWPTPLLKLNLFKQRNVWAKLEFMNPLTHSIKDRTALGLIKSLGNVDKGVIEVSSGNLAVALASILRARGIDYIAYVPSGSPRSFKVMLKLMGVKVVEREGNTSSILPEVINEAKKLGLSHPNQFSNPANYMIHYNTTAREIDEQCRLAGFKPKYIIGAVGTAGHMTGISMYFKEKYGNDVKVIAVQPSVNSTIPGIKRINGNNPFSELLKVDQVIDVSREQALIGVVKVARSDGLLIGLSSGAVAYAAMSLNVNDAVLIFPDDAWKYIDELDYELTQVD